MEANVGVPSSVQETPRKRKGDDVPLLSLNTLRMRLYILLPYTTLCTSTSITTQ